MRNVNYEKSKKLHLLHWENRDINHQDFVRKSSLKEGRRNPKEMPSDKIERIHFLRELLKSEETHEFSGALFLDYKELIVKKLRDRAFFMKYLTNKKPIFSEPCLSGNAVLSETETIYYSGYYYLISSSQYYTNTTLNFRHEIIYRSNRPIEINIKIYGSVRNYAYGSFK